MRDVTTTTVKVNNGQWTPARFKSFIVGQLRSATQRWGPKQKCIQRAKVSHGLYKCEGCGTIGPPTLPPEVGKKRRIKNIVADHINTIVPPEIGFTTYDDWITRAFCELDGFQALCHKCHTIKSNEEKAIAKSAMAKLKQTDPRYANVNPDDEMAQRKYYKYGILKIPRPEK